MPRTRSRRNSTPRPADYGPGSGGLTYKIEPGSPKFNKIASAAILACVPISPSRDLGLQAPTAAQMDAVLKDAYGTLSPSSSTNGAIGPRLDHKLAYAMQNTDVQIRFFHKNQEPPLQTYDQPDDPGEFYFNEVGWQDTITVTVNYQFPLLPGAGADAGAVCRRAQRNRHGGGVDPEARRRLHLSLAGLGHHRQRRREIGGDVCLSVSEA